MTRDDFPHLTHFLSAYFHQDWTVESPDATAVIHAYLRGEPTASVKATAQEVEQLLNASLDEVHLRTFLLDELGCYYDPRSESLSTKEWLRGVLTELESSL